jgi:hypothetical protein
MGQKEIMRILKRGHTWLGHILTLCVLASVVSFLYACQQELTPEESLRSFLRAVSTGDSDTGWSLLSNEARQGLETRAEVGRNSMGTANPEALEAKQLLTGIGLVKTYQLESIDRSETEEASETRVVLVLKTNEKILDEIAMKRQEGTWRVDLLLPPANP